MLLLGLWLRGVGKRVEEGNEGWLHIRAVGFTFAVARIVDVGRGRISDGGVKSNGCMYT